MNIIVYSQSAEMYSEILQGVGHIARTVWQNDVIPNVVKFEPPDCIIYDLRDEPVIVHEKIIEQITEYRLIIIAKREDSLIPYLAGLGVRDFLFTPINPEDIVYRIENPTTPTEAAELLKTVPGLQPERIIEVKTTEQVKKEAQPPKEGFLKSFFTKKQAAEHIKDAEGDKNEHYKELAHAEHSYILKPKLDTPTTELEGGVEGDFIKELEEIKNSINIDSLTGLHNRKYLLEKLSKMNKYSLAMIDIDNFKLVNDRYGHTVGDEVLKFLAHFLKSKVRHTDIVARFGGEEFIIVFSDIDVKQGINRLDRIREELAKTLIPIPENRMGISEIQITFSAGVVKGNKDYESVINKADKLMYKAKENGRNQIQPSTKGYFNFPQAIKKPSERQKIIKENKSYIKDVAEVTSIFAITITSISSIMYNLIKTVINVCFMAIIFTSFIWFIAFIVGKTTLEGQFVNYLISFKLLVDSTYATYIK